MREITERSRDGWRGAGELRSQNGRALGAALLGITHATKRSDSVFLTSFRSVDLQKPDCAHGHGGPRGEGEALSGKFVIYKDKAGEWRFCLKAGNGEVILVSEGYKQKSGCENGVASVKKNAADEAQFEFRMSPNDKPFFYLRAGNHQVVGRSQLYESNGARKNGIRSVMMHAPDASIERID